MTLYDAILGLLCHKDNGIIPSPLAEEQDQFLKRIIERNGPATYCVQA